MPWTHCAHYWPGSLAALWVINCSAAAPQTEQQSMRNYLARSIFQALRSCLSSLCGRWTLELAHRLIRTAQLLSARPPVICGCHHLNIARLLHPPACSFVSRARAVLKRTIPSRHRNTLNNEARTYGKTDSSDERVWFVCPANISDLFCHIWQLEILSRLRQYTLKILTDLSEESALGQLVYVLVSPELSLNETRQIKRKQLMRAAAFNLHHALRLQPWLRNYACQCQLFTFEARGGRVH